jgi:hypothetical protein
VFNKILSLFILITIVFSFANEVELSLLDSHEEATIKKAGFIIFNSTLSDGCDDCHDEGCCDHNTHCSHHCSGLHNLIESKQPAKINCFEGIISKVTWYFNFHYDEPFLDPSLKPPLFS